MNAIAESPLRPSLLPKIAACSCYEPESAVGPAADRGTRLDLIFREALADEERVFKLDSLDAEAVGWAVDSIKILAGGAAIETRESELRITGAGLSGTADALCEARSFSADLKTGEVRNYDEQQACYALGFMERFFEDEWTVHLLYCDARQIETREFNREEAETLVRGVIARRLDPARAPTPCDYCGWCAVRFTCQARVEQVAWLMNLSLGALDIDKIKTDDTRLGDMLQRIAAVTRPLRDIDEALREHAKNRIANDRAKVPGCSLITKRGGRFMEPHTISRWIADLGHGPVLDAYGSLSEAKAREVWARQPQLKFPEDEVREGPGSTYVRVSSKK